MNSLTHWFSPTTMHSLGGALLHFLWQGLAVSAVAGLAMAFCRRAQSRYAISVAALAVMLAAPVGTFIYLSYPRTLAAGSYSLPAPHGAAIHYAATTSMAIRQLSSSIDLSPWLVELWLLGVACFSLRSAGGFLLVERERRRHSESVSDRVLAMCKVLQKRIGLERTIRYCECKWLQAPAVIGWFRPIVLLPMTALSGLSEEQLRSIVAHELAHIQRFDAFVNAFQVVVETLLFYHPAVWWLNRRIRAEREHCCDDAAVRLCGDPLEYARALTLMEEWRGAPVLAMAANRGPLSERILRILGLKSATSGTRGISLVGGVLSLTAAVIAGNALFGMAYPNAHVSAVSSGRSSIESPRAVGFALQSSSAPKPSPAASPKPSAAHPEAEAQPVSGGSYLEAMKAAGLGDLSADQLISMKIQDVTPEYVRNMHEQGLHPDVNQLVSMRIQDVTPEYIRDVHSLGFNPSVDQFVSMKIQGVSTDYIKGLKEAGVQPTVDQLVSMRIQGVTPDGVRGFHEQGLQPDANQLVSMRIQGVSPEYVRDIHALGVKPTVDQFVSMRIQDVTPDYIKALQSAGLKFSVDDAISAKIQEITPAFVDRAVKHGFKDLTINKLIQLKHLGILESPADI